MLWEISTTDNNWFGLTIYIFLFDFGFNEFLTRLVRILSNLTFWNFLTWLLCIWLDFFFFFSWNFWIDLTFWPNLTLKHLLTWLVFFYLDFTFWPGYFCIFDLFFRLDLSYLIIWLDFFHLTWIDFLTWLNFCEFVDLNFRFDLTFWSDLLFCIFRQIFWPDLTFIFLRDAQETLQEAMVQVDRQDRDRLLPNTEIGNCGTDVRTQNTLIGSQGWKLAYVVVAGLLWTYLRTTRTMLC